MTGPEIVLFAEALNAIYEPEEIVPLLLGLNRKFSTYVLATQTFPEQLVALVTAANNKMWIHELVSLVVKENPQSPQIKQFLATYPAWETHRSAPILHPVDSLCVFGGKSFIGRPDLRKYLKKMSSGQGRNTLLVTGEHRKTGKTYSKEMIGFLSYNQPPSKLAYIDLSKDQYDSGKLVADIAAQMQLDLSTMPSQGGQQATRWNQELAGWLIPAAPDAMSVFRWIVLDSFRQRMPSEELQDLIAQMAQRVQSTPDFRLVLIDYSYPLPIAVRGFMYDEKVLPLKPEEVEDFLRQVHRQKHGAEPECETLSDYVEGVYEKRAALAQQYPDMADDHLLLNMAVTEAVEIIREE